MTIDIWSDIMCPFCYIGKRRLEQALKLFPHKDKIDVKWHSFQLDPGMKSQPGTDLYSYLANRKGQTRDWAIKVHQQLVETAATEGLSYNFDTAVIANSFDAHRLIQMAKVSGLDDAAEERLFHAYFTEGKDISDLKTLLHLGTEIGLDKDAVWKVLESDAYAKEVQLDLVKAESYGITGVPFFILDNKYGISGAQPVKIFLYGLQQAWNEYEQQNNQ
jgi:predicted DsbA family dithiol-disulfide isomerase